MPCPHCPHCQKQAAEEEALKALLAEQQIKEEPSDSFEDVLQPTAAEEIPELNPAQLSIAQEIVSTWETQRLHLIEGIAGIGKTHLLNAIGISLRNVNVKIAQVSLSAHASPSGRTLHSLIHAPEDELLDVKVILIDNVNQVTDDLLKSLSDRLKRVMNTRDNVLFGRKAVVMAADFGLCLPYCDDWNKKAHASPKYFTSGQEFKKHKLPTTDAPWNLMIEEIRKTPRIELPEKKIVSDLDSLINFTFGDLFDQVPNENSILLAPRKKDVELLNREVLDRMDGREISLEAVFAGHVIRGDLDLHEIRVKKDSILILEEKFEDLFKGTRLLLEEHTRTHLNCKVLDGPRKGEQVDIERVERKIGANLQESQQWVRQFPVTLAFAMTIHAAQGRRFDRVGCFKLEEIFEHGMAYTAMSRSKDFRVLTPVTVVPNKIDYKLL